MTGSRRRARFSFFSSGAVVKRPRHNSLRSVSSPNPCSAKYMGMRYECATNAPGVYQVRCTLARFFAPKAPIAHRMHQRTIWDDLEHVDGEVPMQKCQPCRTMNQLPPDPIDAAFRHACLQSLNPSRGDLRAANRQRRHATKSRKLH